MCPGWYRKRRVEECRNLRESSLKLSDTMITEDILVGEDLSGLSEDEIIERIRDWAEEPENLDDAFEGGRGPFSTGDSRPPSVSARSK